MSPAEKLILEAWSEGHGGASLRLSKRAWLILQEAERVNPIAVGKAWGSAADAQAWVLAFRALGLVGLIDAPRTGRPASRSNAVAQVVDELDGARDIDAARALVRGLNRSDKEAVWRANRRTGVVVERGHRMLDLEVPVPSALRDLSGIFISKQLTVIAALERSDQIFEQTRGTWLAVPRGIARPSQLKNLPGRDLLTTLNVRIKATTSSKSDPNSPSARRSAAAEARGSISLLARFMDELVQTSEDHPGRMAIAALTNIEAGEPFVQFLSICRRHRLWTPRPPRYPSALKSMTPFAFNNKITFAFATQAALAHLLPTASDEPIGELLDGIRRPRSRPFCWLRSSDLDEEPDGSDWYGTDVEENS